uniref:Uncharacterized protein n=1 Tax=Romanomermis culicivorax TaxID=13658 RepID=A0A915K952_ROMCU
MTTSEMSVSQWLDGAFQGKQTIHLKLSLSGCFYYGSSFENQPFVQVGLHTKGVQWLSLTTRIRPHLIVRVLFTL